MSVDPKEELSNCLLTPYHRHRSGYEHRSHETFGGGFLICLVCLVNDRPPDKDRQRTTDKFYLSGDVFNLETGFILVYTSL